jgi:hypothetical protein
VRRYEVEECILLVEVEIEDQDNLAEEVARSSWTEPKLAHELILKGLKRGEQDEEDVDETTIKLSPVAQNVKRLPIYALLEESLQELAQVATTFFCSPDTLFTRLTCNLF